MFTGIVTAVGRLESTEVGDQGARVRIARIAGQIALADCRDGDSISVAGVCLSMLGPTADAFAADVSAATLESTTLGDKREGDHVNLELPLRANDRLGGHLVSGHVDTRTALVSRQSRGEAQELEFELPDELARFVCKKGSVCLDGVSLTVNSVSPETFAVCIIPHTLKTTTLGSLNVRDDVNLEVDLIARYLERMK